MSASTTNAIVPIASGAPSTQPLTPEQRRRHEDSRWARHDSEVARQFRGQFVVPFMRQVVAHGQVVAEVLEQASRITGRSVEELPVCFIDDPLGELPR